MIYKMKSGHRHAQRKRWKKMVGHLTGQREEINSVDTMILDFPTLEL